MPKLLSTEGIARIESTITSEQCLKICWKTQVLPMVVIAFPVTWFALIFRFLFNNGPRLNNFDFATMFAMWIMGCGFVVQAAKYPRVWFKDSVMLANTVYEILVCSAAIIRFSPALAGRGDAVWIIGFMVLITMSVYVLTLRSYLVWRSDVPKTYEEEEGVNRLLSDHR